MKIEIELKNKHVKDLIETLARERAELDEMFGLEEDETNGEVKLTFNIEACRAMMYKKLNEGVYGESHEIIDGFLHTKKGYTDIIHYCFTAKPKNKREYIESEE